MENTANEPKVKKVKCVVWDLDNTLWDGILSEDRNVVLKKELVEVIKTLDARGILNSIASKNDSGDALAALARFGLADYFLYPEISWNAKSHSVASIAKHLNIGLDTILFVDDQPFEREEVQTAHPVVRVLDAVEYSSLASRADLQVQFVTVDSARRRLMYLEDMKRSAEEEEYAGPKEAFLAGLEMKFLIQEASEEDLKRVEELTIRTNQLNATGKTYDYDELDFFRTSDKHLLLICELTDKYGSYGKIGVALIEILEDCWHLRLLLMSCRVISRGVGTVFLSHIMTKAKDAGRKLKADFRDTGRNRMMNISFRFANFREIENNGQGDFVFEHDCVDVPRLPDYIDLRIVGNYGEMRDDAFANGKARDAAHSR